MATCYRHPSRETNVSCANCGRPICPDCMTTTPVGMRCPECSRQRTRVVRMREMTSRPEATVALIAVNVLAFLAEGNVSLGGEPSLANDVYRKGALLGSSESPLLAGQGVAHGQWWRLISGGFLHENLLHIGLNMWVLYIVGQLLEPAIGRLKFATVYAVSLLTGSFGALLLTPHSLTVGASGAIFGMMGALAVELRARQIPLMRGGLGSIGGLILINLVFSFSVSGISIGGHIGGLIGGALAMAVIRVGDRYRQQALALAGCAVIGIGALAGGIATAHSSEVETATPSQPLQTIEPGQ